MNFSDVWALAGRGCRLIGICFFLVFGERFRAMGGKSASELAFSVFPVTAHPRTDHCVIGKT